MKQRRTRGYQKNIKSRQLFLSFVAIGGMGVLGCAAMVTQWIKDGWLTQWWHPHDPLFTILLCTSIGGFLGLVTVPWVVPCLLRKDLRIAVPIVYATSFVIVIVFTFYKRTGLTGPLLAAIPAIVSVCFSSLIAKFVLPSKISTDTTRCCPNCSYDLRGDLKQGCPECGWGREAEA
ncbi:MAG: hypothetical protein IH984_14785 [Planctomycetes bacterium]|nr:hypothetical protein [Planctomycetota bacterium]